MTHTVKSSASLIVLVFLIRTTELAADYGNPLRSEAIVTSTFGEFRKGYYHAGVDLSTGSEIGKPVYAVANGSLYRVRASGVGYGKAVYELLDDGKIVLYAHLDSFCEKVSSYVESVQESLSAYEVDLFPEPGMITFEEGELIGMSGESGAGPPHLHFEIRDEDIALNPLTNGFSAPDILPPSIESVIFSPLDCGSTVEGIHFPVKIRLLWDSKKKVFASPRTVSFWGRFSIGVETSDRTGLGGGRLVPYKVELHVDDVPVYVLSFERIPFGRGKEVNTTYERANIDTSPFPGLCLRRYPGTSNSLSKMEEGVGVMLCGRKAGKLESDLFLPAGDHTFIIKAQDASGNTSEAWIPFTVRAPGEIPLAGEGETRKEKIPFEVSCSINYYRHCIGVELNTTRNLRAVRSLKFSGRVIEAPLIEYKPKGKGIELFLDYEEELENETVTALLEDTSGAKHEYSFRLAFKLAQPWESGEVMSPDGVVRFSYERGTFFTREPIAVFKSHTEERIQGLSCVSPVVSIRPLEIPFDGRGKLSINFPESLSELENIGVFAVYPQGIEFIGGKTDTVSRTIEADIQSFSDYVLLRDEFPPVARIGAPRLRIEYGRAYLFLTIKVEERGSGISSSGIEVYIDGKKAVSEWSPDESEIRVRVKNPPLGKKVRVKAAVRDRLGNEATSESMITVGE